MTLITTVSKVDTERLHDLARAAVRELEVRRDIESAVVALGELETQLMCLHMNGRLHDWASDVIHLNVAWKEGA